MNPLELFNENDENGETVVGDSKTGANDCINPFSALLPSNTNEKISLTERRKVAGMLRMPSLLSPCDRDSSSSSSRAEQPDSSWNTSVVDRPWGGDDRVFNAPSQQIEEDGLEALVTRRRGRLMIDCINDRIQRRNRTMRALSRDNKKDGLPMLPLYVSPSSTNEGADEPITLSQSRSEDCLITRSWNYNDAKTGVKLHPKITNLKAPERRYQRSHRHEYATYLRQKRACSNPTKGEQNDHPFLTHDNPTCIHTDEVDDRDCGDREDIKQAAITTNFSTPVKSQVHIVKQNANMDLYSCYATLPSVTLNSETLKSGLTSNSVDTNDINTKYVYSTPCGKNNGNKNSHRPSNAKHVYSTPCENNSNRKFNYNTKYVYSTPCENNGGMSGRVSFTPKPCLRGDLQYSSTNKSTKESAENAQYGSSVTRASSQTAALILDSGCYKTPTQPVF